MTKSPRHPGLVRFVLRGTHLLLVSAFLAAAAGLAFAARPLAIRPPRDPARIGQVLATGPHAGDCDQCHTTHGGDQPLVYPNALVGPDDNQLCARCHDTPWKGGSYAGDDLYRATGHGSSTSMIWPGPEPAPRIEPDAATKCMNCHDPHGWTDAIGTIPFLGLQREEKLCLACHDGSPATSNIAGDVTRPYRHPVGDFTDRHKGPLESDPADFGTTPINNRHSECVDCHDPHTGRQDGPGEVSGNGASKRTLGVSRVLVLNGAAGMRPIYTFVPGSDTLTTPNAEYQLCFKCHSSWTTQPGGQTDFGVVLNPANPSTHPVEAEGRNPNILALAFTNGWSANSLTRCGDCHGSDFGSTAGPHGSTNPGILRAEAPASSVSRTMSNGELCFRCHEFNVYGNPSTPAMLAAYSRFNAPAAEKGHSGHVGDEHVPCYACHTTHGSTTLPFLLVTGRNPGLTSYTSTAGGGTCTSTCHDSKTYTVNYAR